MRLTAARSAWLSKAGPLLSSLALLILLARPPHLLALNSTTPGVLTSPYPTLTNLAVVWEITGDDNLDCNATIEYRETGSADWHTGMPLRRIPHGQSIATTPIFNWNDKLSGSLLGLRPGTEYEIRVSLSDPDGGAAQRLITARTRSVPCAPADSTVVTANPSTLNSVISAAVPGRVIVLAPGNYGRVGIHANGTLAKPVVIRGTRDDTASVVFDSLSLRSCSYVILDNLTINSRVDIGLTDGVAIRYCRVNATYGITADNENRPARNAYIADNTVTSDVPWDPLSLGSEGANVGEGIQVTGPGNVICFNRVYGYRDCISLMEDTSVKDQFCIDIYNNDIYVGADDAIEADFCQGNCRITENRITNSFMGLSSQPGLGGPTYFIRNVMYNIIDCPFKLARYSKGDVVLHNTIVKVGSGLRVIHNPSYAYFRNNLAIGGKGGGDFGQYGSGDGRAIEFDNADSTDDLDYDGVGCYQYANGEFLAKVDGIRAWSIEELRATRWEKHAVQVGLDVFATTPTWPDPPFPERAPADLRLAAGSAAIDTGLPIPNVNDGFTGQAPDLGAYELGQPLPHYGPRPLGVDETVSLTGRMCDFSGDGRASLLDVLAMLLLARQNPSDPLLDLDGDGMYTLQDVRLLIQDIMAGRCRSGAAALASAGGSGMPEYLEPADIGYLEESIRALGLSSEQTGLLLDVLHGGAAPAELPRSFSLAQNYPNPFNPSTAITFSVPEGNHEWVSLRIFGLRGRLMRSLMEGDKAGGSYTVFWDGTDQAGQAAPSGVYFYRLKAGDFSQTRKMVLLK